MSKEVIFAGILAVGCLVLVGVAFIAPHKPKHEVEVVKTDAPTETVAPTGDLLTGDGTTGSIAQGTAGTSASGFTTTGGTTAGFTGTAGTTGAFTGSPASTSGFTGATSGSAFSTGGSTSGSFTGGSSTGSFTSGGTTTGSFSGGSTFTGGSSGFTGGSTTGGVTRPTGTSGSTTGGSTTSSEKTHIIAKNETLAEISQKYFGTAKNWKKIVDANPGLDPKSMKVGQKITIPALSDAPTTPDSPTVASGDHTYTVKAGDSYYTIAKKELNSASRWKEIEKLNGIGPEELHVGQVIKLPSAGAASTVTKEPNSGGTEATFSGKTHVVASGETLSDISKKYFGTTTRWKDIVKANPGVDPETLKVGQKITIPDMPATDGGGATGGTTGGTSSTGSASTGEYVVKPHDTMQSIAEHELGNRNAWKKIVDANPGVDAHNLRVGQKIKIPGKASTGTAPAQDDTRPSGTTTFGGTTSGFTSTTGGTTGFGTTTGSFSGTTGGSTGTSGFGATTGFSGGTTTGGFSAAGTTGGATGPRPFTASGTTGSAATAGSTAPRGGSSERISP